jgi:hypothetical protein
MDFVFGYPSDWIETTRVEDWTWQKDNWSTATVAEALEVKLEQMYAAITENVADMPNVSYSIEARDGARTVIHHDPRVTAVMQKIGGFGQHQYLSEPLALHHSDRDFYSISEWNSNLCKRVNGQGGRCLDFTYQGNTHSLGVSDHEWFSPAGSIPGFSLAIQRDVALFSNEDPTEIVP